MNTTQQHLSIKDIQDEILLLKGGGGALILQVSAVNFGLLSDREQMAIIAAFAQMLNSLSFSIQIMIHSERLNINSYLELLDKAQRVQTNPLLSQMITQYKQFVQNTIRENEVLDKKFYIVIPLFKLELGLSASSENLKQKVKTILLPRRDQLIRQLSRVGLKAMQLNKQKLIELFFDIYNGQIVERNAPQTITVEQISVKLNSPKPVITQQTHNIPQAPTPTSLQFPPIPTNIPNVTPIPIPQAPNQTPARYTSNTTSRNQPFVVEELA